MLLDVIFGDVRARPRCTSRWRSGTATAPSNLGLGGVNADTITRYHVEQIRADGRTPGVGSSYGFDAGHRHGVSRDDVRSSSFSVVAKEETPCTKPASPGSPRSQLHPFGYHQAGKQVTATGSIQADFGNYGDF